MNRLAVAEAELRFKMRYDAAYAAELAKVGLPRFGVPTGVRQRAAMRALSRLMDDAIIGELKSA